MQCWQVLLSFYLTISVDTLQSKGFLPFQENDTLSLYKKIINEEFYIPDYLSAQSVDFLKQLLKKNPD